MYSVGPLPAPVQDGPAGALGEKPMGEKTVMVPPPTPAWAPASAPPGDPESTATWTFDPDAEGYTPTGGLPSLPGANGAGSANGNGAGGNGAGAPPPPAWANEQPNAAGQAPANGQANGQAPMNGHGPAQANGQGTGQQPALGAAPASNAPALPPAGGFPGGSLAPDAPPPPVESIVPESWFAQPRKPDPQDAGDATQVYGAPQQPQQPAGQGWGAPLPVAGTPPQGDPAMMDADATQLAPGGPMGAAPLDGRTRMDFGAGGGFDQTRMDPGGTSVMGAPPMGQGGPGGFGGYGDPAGPGMPMNGPMNPMNPMGPGGPGHPQGPGRSGGGTSKPLLIGVAALVVVALAAVAFVVWPSGGKGDDASPKAGKSSSKPVSQNERISSAEKQQAQAMSAVLDASVDARRVLAGALGRAGRCKDMPVAVQGFQNAVQRRQNQLNRTRGLKVGQLTKGEQLRSSLAQALQASLQVDQLLLRWAQSQAHCHGKPKPNAAHVPGRAQGERRATQAKQRFVALWNPVARKTGQPVRSWGRV
ncbi:large adhesin [Actinomadura verrucosospora]|uniref:Large adhesin n=1 Tax=Actinomadura verrucosospora TaxID=46165 RepID=A0A7D4ARD8_ACTVE|nr:large adhesin [Actinomadura verrucosospora]